MLLISQFNLYPNPATNNVFIEDKQGLVIEKSRFFSILGQEFNLRIVNNSFDCNALVPGLYFIELQTKNNIEVLRFIKK